MADIIKAEDPLYARYEEVLLRRENLRKEAEQYYLEFIKIFGDLIEESFRMKIECIRKKKMISYCQKMMNIGKDVNWTDLNRYIEREMAEYEKELDDIIRDVNATRGAWQISDAEVHKVKKIYYALAKLIHPDMHPELADDMTLKDYWEKITRAYQHNDIEELQELDELVRMYLAGRDPGSVETKIDNIDQKIAKVEKDIEEILSTNPYLYKLLLSDEKEKADKKQEYEDEIAAYTKYSAELDDILSSFEIQEGVLS